MSASFLKKSSEIVFSHFPFSPTEGQRKFFKRLDLFFSKEPEVYNCFVLKGYAGTGKTTVISALVKSARELGFRTVLIAPTGRAAKVMGAYSGRKAFTIHRLIYKAREDLAAGFVFELQTNKYRNTLFIVDEASMINDEPGNGTRGLLRDLLEYTMQGENNKLILVGDTAQLPPVGTLSSPALDPYLLESYFGLKVLVEELSEVMRQSEESGILWNATRIRREIDKNPPIISIDTRSCRDILRNEAVKLEDGLRYAFDKYGEENTVVLTRSNKAAVQYNQYIRRIIRFAEDEIDAGDRLMIVRNNYKVLDEDSRAGFLANGDFVELQKVWRYEEMHGFRFADVTLRLLDYENEPPFEAKINLDILHSNDPALSSADARKLYENVALDYADIESRSSRTEAIRKDPYLNALQVKFAYALTCHKAQGGQWDAVFVDQGYVPENQTAPEFLRWLYTAVTRATSELYLLNFNPAFFKE